MKPIHNKAVVFHVGAHKTGTSLLQKYMRDNVRLLRRRHICYLSRSAMNGYIGWGDALLRDPEALDRKLHRTLLNPWFRVVIASHENTLGRPFRKYGTHLYPRGPEIIDALGRLLRPHRPRVFLSIRPQEELLESYYLQSVHEGHYRRFDAWLGRIDLDAISWVPLVEKLVDTFGRDRVEIVDFRLIKQGQEAYIREFFGRVGYTFDVEYTAMRNPSISDKGLRMALAANPHLRSGEERKLMRKFLQGNFSNLRYPRPCLLSDEQERWLRERYGAEYEQLTGGPHALAVPPGQAADR